MEDEHRSRQFGTFRGLCSPLGWTRAFVDTLTRIYPDADNVAAHRVATSRYLTDKSHGPIIAAELFALEEGRPKI